MVSLKNPSSFVLSEIFLRVGESVPPGANGRSVATNCDAVIRQFVCSDPIVTLENIGELILSCTFEDCSIYWNISQNIH